MARRPTLAKVALAAGVSKSTAGNVLSGRKTMSVATTQRVLAAAHALGYRADPKASGLSRGTASTLGVFYSGYMPDYTRRPSTIFWPRLNEGLVRRCAQAGTVVAFCGPNQAQELIDCGVDALLVLGQGIEDFDSLHIPFGMPIIAADPIPGRTVSFDIHDPYTVTRVVVDHFVAHERLQIGWLRGVGAENMFDRWTPAFAELAASDGASFTVAHHDLSSDGIGSALDELLAANVNAIFATFANSVKLASELRKRGIRLPDDVALVVLAEGLIEEAMTPALSTLSMKSIEVGEVIAEYCLDAITQAPYVARELPLELVVRESSLCIPGADDRARIAREQVHVSTGLATADSGPSKSPAHANLISDLRHPNLVASGLHPSDIIAATSPAVGVLGGATSVGNGASAGYSSPQTPN